VILPLATIIKKKIRKQVYYYAVESKRVDGKPRIVWQQYLGKFDDIVRRAQQDRQKPVEAKIFEFGAVAALYHLATKIGLVELIDQVVPKRNQGASVGQYMLLAAINRAVHPVSKSEFADWYTSTSLPRWIDVSPKALTSQRFWDHMARLDQAAIEQIEERLTRQLVLRFDLDLRCLIYDATNFFTWIDTAADAQLPQRGHNKAKRNDLKQVGLAMMVTTDFHIPLFHRIYAGNTTDSKQFGSVLTDLSDRYKAIAESCENVTLVFDKGNNAKHNFSALADSPFHFVGSLSPSQHADLLAIAADQFRPLTNPRLGGVTAHRTCKTLFGVERTVVITYNESLYLGQKQGLLLQRRKANDALRELQRRVLTAFEPGKRGKKPTVESVRKQVQAILKERKLKGDWLQASVEQTEHGIAFTYSWDHEAIARYEESTLGKTLLFTDQSSWTEEEIVLAYRGQSKIEEAFKKMKNPHFLSWTPRYHWTDPMIRVHAFYCILALTLTSLLQRELYRKGIPLSTTEMLAQLSEIREVAHIYPEGSGIKPQITLTRCSELQEKLVKELEISSYRSDFVGNTSSNP